MNLQLALDDLDKHASEFNFPVLDNAYVAMAAARLTAFRDGERWAITFEVLGYSRNDGCFVNDLYAFGPCLEKEGFISSRSVMSPLSDHPLIDSQTEAWIADWESWSIVVKGMPYVFTPSRNEYTSQGIDVPIKGGPGSLSGDQIMRFFIHKEGAGDLFMQESELRDELRLGSEMSIFIQTERWQHPDVAGEEKPSENVAIRSLLAALESNSPADFQRGNPNTDWQHWASGTG
jgi:Family of unknown function (DUF7003)